MKIVSLSRAALMAASGLWFEAAPASTFNDPAYGLWLTENARAIIEIGPCEEQACGRIVWMDEPTLPDGTPKTDQNNPDKALQSRTICGIPLVGGFSREKGGVWRDGFVYNPKDGKTYDAEITSVGPDKLKMRGFVLVPAFGRSQTWTRVPDSRGGC